MTSAPTEPAKGTHRRRETVMETGEGGWVRLIRHEGDLDMATADGLTERGCAAISGGTRVLLIDLARLPFCDARGLSALVRIANDADRAGCRYGLLAAQPQLVRLLRLTGLGQRLPVFATVGDALAQLMPPAADAHGRAAATRPQHGIVVPAVLAGPASSARSLPGHLRHRRAWRQARALSAAPVPQAGPCAW